MPGCLHPHLAESRSCSRLEVGAREQSTNGGCASPMTHLASPRMHHHLVCGHPLIFRRHRGLAYWRGCSRARAICAWVKSGLIRSACW